MLLVAVVSEGDGPRETRRLPARVEKPGRETLRRAHASTPGACYRTTSAHSRPGAAKSSPADPPDTPVGRPRGAVWPLGPRSGPQGCEYSTKPQGRVQGVSCIAPARGARALRDGCGDSHEGRKHPTGNTAWKHPDRIPLSLVNRAGQGPDRPHRRRTQSRLRRPGPSPIHREGRSRPSLRQRRPLRPLPRGWASPGPASPPFASQSSS